MHYSGLVLREIMRRCVAGSISVDNAQQNATYGITQARVMLSGDPVTYRLIIAPSDAPIMVNGHHIGGHFAKPLGAG